MNTRSSRVLVLALLMVGVSLLGYRMWISEPNSEYLMTIPKSGHAANDTGGKIPGNPQNGIDDLKRLYTWISVYRKRHDGRYPVSILLSLMPDVRKSPGEYGVKSVKEAFEILSNPDSQFGDWTKQSPKTTLPYAIARQRPDGSRIGSPKKSGTKDIIAACNLYYHANIRVFPDERSTQNPVGFHLVLWENGEVTKVSYDKMLFIPNGSGNSFGQGFPGQAGVPQNSLTYDQFYKRTGWKRGGPRGSEGGKGQSYDSDRG